MYPKRFIPFVFLAAISLHAQSVRLEPTLANAQAEYRDAEETWLKSDPHLESDLYRSDRQEVRRRILRAAALRDDVMRKKTTYLDLIVKRMMDLEARMNSTKTAPLPTQDFKRDIEDEQARLREERARLEGRMQELPAGEEYAGVRTTMAAEQSDLASLQTDAERRMTALDRLSKAQEAETVVASQNDLPQKIDELRKIWEGERERAARARIAWTQYYAGLEKSLDTKQGSKKGPVR